MTVQRDLSPQPDPRSRAGLRAALDEWVQEHGYVWFDSDLRLAGAIASFLGITLEIDGLAASGTGIGGVTKE